MWSTVCPPCSPSLMTILNPFSSDSFLATRAAVSSSLPKMSSSVGWAEDNPTILRFGITNTCTGAWGLMSLKQNVSSSSYTASQGISLRISLSNIVYVIIIIYTTIYYILGRSKLSTFQQLDMAILMSLAIIIQNWWNLISNIKGQFLGYLGSKGIEVEYLAVGLQISQMKQQEGQRHPDPHQSSAFEKNYPKNIFLMMVQYLSQLGLRQQCQETFGSIKSIQTKNVVSLRLFYTLFTCPWFPQLSIPHLIVSVSNRILLSAKIKRKMFHLRLLRGMFTLSLTTFSSFRKGMIAMAAERFVPKYSHSFTSFRSGIAYLLILTLRHFSRSLRECRLKTIVEEMEVRADFGNKKDIKDAIKYICLVVNGQECEGSQLLKQGGLLKEYIREEGRRLNLLYKLGADVPMWDEYEGVIDKIIEKNRKKNKVVGVPSIELTSWVLSFKRSFKIGRQGGREELMEGQQEKQGEYFRYLNQNQQLECQRQYFQGGEKQKNIQLKDLEQYPQLKYQHQYFQTQYQQQQNCEYLQNVNYFNFPLYQQQELNMQFYPCYFFIYRKENQQ